VGACLTVADSKRAFHRAFPFVIAPLYRRMVDELLVELHLLSHQKGFRAEGLFAVGLIQVFESFSKGYRPEEQRQPLFEALCGSSGFSAADFENERQSMVAAVGHHSLEELSGWLTSGGAGGPAPIADALNAVKQADFHYSRLAAVGLLTLLQQAAGADALEPAALRQSAHEIGEAMGLLKSRLDKDLSLYASNVEKMAQAVELMEETVAADRRRRERQLEAAAQPAAAPPAPTEPGPSTP
jgi:photosystem II biogenesis protein Psp29